MKDLEKVLNIEDGVLVECEQNFSGELVIPNSVTKISSQAFSCCGELASVVIPDSVTEIDNYAFEYCEGLTSVKIPNSVVRIGDYAFLECRGLTEVTIPESVKEIGALAFDECSNLKTVNYNATECTSAGFDEEEGCCFGLFNGCTSLTTVNIGGNVTVIPESAFGGCDKLTAVHYNGDIDGWCKIFFGDLHANPLNYAHNLYINNELLTDLVIPDTITEINDFAFSYATGLKSVKIPDSVTRIGWSAFLGCTGLTTLTVPDSVTCIMPHAFSGCSKLADITIPESLTSIAQSTFFETAWYNSQPDGVLYMAKWCLGYKGGALSGSLAIQEGTRGIARNAFDECNELTSVVVPDSVLYICDFAFSGLKKLKSVTLGKSLTKIGNATFSNCSSLTGIVLPDSVTEIGKDAFGGCKKLKSVALGKSLAKIGNSAFDDCVKLAEITLPGSVTEIGIYAFRDCKKLNMKIPASVTIFDDYSLSGCHRNSTDIECKYNVVKSDLLWNCKNEHHITFSLAEQTGKWFMLLPRQDNYIYLHVGNETSEPFAEEELDRLIRSVADYMQVGEKLTTRGGVTPGGLNLIKRFANYGFDKVDEYCDEFTLMWSGDALCKECKVPFILDYEKFAKWLNNPAHKNDFKILKDDAPISEQNTCPIVWELEKK